MSYRKVLQAKEMRCYGKILRVDHVTNVEVRNRIQHAIGCHEDRMTTVKENKLIYVLCYSEDKIR